MKQKYQLTILILFLICLIPYKAEDIIDQQNEPITSTNGLRPLKYGVDALLFDLDPQFAWDRSSINHINQVCEGLFAINNTDPNHAPIPRLASSFGYWTEGSDGFHGKQWEYIVSIKDNVYFHDGSKLSTKDVVFTFDRLTKFLTSEFEMTQFKQLYEPLKKIYPETPLLINRTEALDMYQVKFVLNYKYMAFESLLAFSGSYILSDFAGSTPENDFYGRYQTLIGTGPFRQISHTDELTIFRRFENYHRSLPTIEEMHWIRSSDSNAKNQAFLDGELDYIDNIDSNFKTQYEDSSRIHLEENTPSGTIYYLEFNNGYIDVNTRRAMQDAFDIEDVFNNLSTYEASQINRMTSIIPKGVLYHNESIPLAFMDLTAARQHMLDAITLNEQGLNLIEASGLTISSSDAEWESRTIATYDYGYNTGNIFRENVGKIAKENFAKIGIKLNLLSKSWMECLQDLYSGSIQLFVNGWSSDINDPTNTMDNLFGIDDVANLNFTDPNFNTLSEAGLTEENKTIRESIYGEMQAYLVDVAPVINLYERTFESYSTDEFSGIFGKNFFNLDFYDTVWTGEISTDENDDDGDGLPNGDEIELYLTNPNNPDSDGDGLDDKFEITYGSDPWLNDTDGDNLLDWDEFYLYGTSLIETDSDSDGLDDEAEVLTYFTNPNLEDSDSDGLIDYDELYVHLTNPLSVDTDNDNILDNFELKLGTDPNDDDSDNDGFFDGYEVKMGTNPLSAESYPGDGQTSTDTSTSTSDTQTSTSDTQTSSSDNPFEDFFSSIPGFSSSIMLFAGIVVSISLIYRQKNKKK